VWKVKDTPAAVVVLVLRNVGHLISRTGGSGARRERPYRCALEGSIDELRDATAFCCRGPSLGFQALQAQANALSFPIHVEDIHSYLVAHLQDLAGMRDAMPRNLGQVHQALDSAQIDKRPKVSQAGHLASQDIALLHIGQPKAL
jgi:hypothetical protein